MKIENSTILITGANRGIGRSLVISALERGAEKIYATARNIKSLDQIIALDPQKIIPIGLDITNRNQVSDVANIASDVNILINNAGILAAGSIIDDSLEMVIRDMDTNYFGTLNMIRSFVPNLKNNSESAIANVLSIVSLSNMPAIAGYSASKSAAFSMTQAIRSELAKNNISVHSVYPGPVDTDMAKDFEMDKASPDDVAKNILDGIENGDDDIFPDQMSAQCHQMWESNPKDLEKQFGTM